jgi:hypothetical protein
VSEIICIWRACVRELVQFVFLIGCVQFGRGR